MYGMINRAIQEMVTAEFGPERWLTIAGKAGLDEASFMAMQQYPDAVTYALVGAASDELGVPARDLLEAFGEYWVLYTAKEGYGDLLRSTGPTLRSCLQNLDMLHARVGLSFPHLQPPSFRCTDIQTDRLILHYHSDRPGLAPLVIGLLKGLAKTYDTPVTVTHTVAKDAGADRDEFLVQFA